MTAYGRGEVEGAGQKWTVELRSLNHRFLELSLNLPKRLWALEDRFRKLVKSRVARGRVEMQLTWESVGEKPFGLEVDEDQARGVRRLLETVQTLGDLSGPLQLEHYLHFSDQIITKVQESQFQDLEETWTVASQAVSQALDLLDEMRQREGEALAQDLATNLENIRRQAAGITDQTLDLPRLWRERVMARLTELFPEGSPVDEVRLAQEVALMAERRDLGEELARLESHLAQFQETLSGDAPVGRKQEFLLQELLREANTIGSKAGDLAISQAVLEIKGALERLREQVQNIE
jgi:uncharacterized protein (TIGR00255 family)